jgi:hypothetical protein
VSERLLQSRRSRQTGTTVDVIRHAEIDGDWPSDQHPAYRRWYETICVDHGGVCEHDTRALAERFAPVPREWCPTCQEEESDDDGDD